jgi:tetratricopeptide (TPR) repeat protein
MEMKRAIWTICLAALAAALLSSCQMSAILVTQIKASKAMIEGRYEDSVALYREVLQKDADNVEALKGLGETYLRMKKEPEAVAVLAKALRLSPDDRMAAVNLGLAHNLNGEYDKAIGVWRAVVEKDPDSNLSAVLRKQITLALYKDAAKQAKEAVQRETALKTAPGEPNTLAVTYFGAQGQSEQSIPLRKALAAMLITDLSKSQSLKVVERIRMERLLEEIRLGESGLVDARTAPRICRLLGAGKIVSGNLLVAGGGKMEINSLLTSVATKAEAGRQQASGPVNEFFKIEKAIAFGIVRDTGVSLTKAEEETIGRYATQSHRGLLYYGEGLDAQDRGEWDRAIAIFQKCLTEDPTGPCAAALAEAPSGDDAAAAGSVAGMSTAAAAAASADASAGSSGSDGGG